ncbi:MAG: ATP-binding cassette domain-containing protein, partial [Candidatus Doudnabacteria bacterium]|nr:ATP-binding cassette domain-containing protein [Candidatus Doudnabacteria bacterium]
MSEPILQLKSVTTYYGGLKALNDVSVDLHPGEIVALMGPNGAGKSTVLKAIFGLVDAREGSILWKNEKIKPVTHQMVERGVAFVPQGRRVFTHLTVEGNLEIAGEVVKTGSSIKDRIEEVFQFFHELRKKRKAKSGTL